MCPECGEPLVTFELEGIETDHCQKCGGAWLDAGEIEEIAERSGGSKKLRAALKSAGESPHGKRKCVRCSAPLTAVSFGTVILDRCPYGHGIWFDKGEIAAVIRADGGELGGYLKEMFKHEIWSN